MPLERFDPASAQAEATITITSVTGDLTQLQDVDGLVNPWNRNYMPRWLLYPSGVSRALKSQTGPDPWKELSRAGVLPVGGCVVTDAGRLSAHTKLIHVAGLNLAWRATEATVSASVHSVVRAAVAQKMRTVAMPLIGSGSGGMNPTSSRECIENALRRYTSGWPLEVLLVEHDKAA
ncbi:O-acetyl-ADP-ribose deacetylase (regulator of RNase III) [Branchiibius hedensis]|uniref:O-acetyl-ADP-ribose deacetylase (Regulator of RNase III), contains Macro domain n=1 Tax=Branchiibius hedensis TaxID=672460 RepID=A0A2Y9BLD2_9MICO|nr:macro domain-containing protein [Branchiibius hedensis]PWJ23260.1 O-acetyl-ADP-ribose deacetylase (regulator of RNase III) [Branchiibius hedensis]PWJ23370.1 O-acetyl-ADP-ribose deacetylase (regulator of RNase III) [Branchiibius hedensis]SSA58949.1 O-acetyl-ADP-ribose deacetylase (regulator of RNase III), contains Macro domain [Branchiibius hedensis]SSA59058.1 O-acetyl-ADP-ribose deacetylase (regulator of RNase III), contains Macro domain [Branchiibius hedensis]